MSQRFGASIATPAPKLGESSQQSYATTLPQPITDAGRLSLARLPIDPNTTLKWQCFSSHIKEGETSSEDIIFQDSIHNLMRITQEKAQFNASNHSNFQSTTLKSTLWSCQGRRIRVIDQKEEDTSSNPSSSLITRRIIAIWLFEFDSETKFENEQVAGSSKSVNDEYSNSVQKERENLMQSGLTCTEGSCKLNDIYTSPLSNGLRGSACLLPASKEKRNALKYFLVALEDHLLSKWVWTRHQERTSSFDRNHETQTQKQSIHPTFQNMANKEVKPNLEDEEEGALDGEGVTDINGSQAQSQYSSQKLNLFWSDSRQARQCPIVRFGKGVMMYDKTYLKDDCSPLQYVEDSPPIHMALQCFVDGQGHLYIETWPRKLPVSRNVAKQDLGKERTLLLAPLMTKVQMICYLGPIDTDMDSQQIEDKSILDSREALFSLLRMYSVDTSFLRNEWVKCTYQGRIFAWPAQLCLLYEEISSLPNARMPSLMESTLTDVTAKARRFIRETLGLEITPEPVTSASQDEEDEEMDEEEDTEQEGQGVEESTDIQPGTQANQPTIITTSTVDETAKMPNSAADAKKSIATDGLNLPVSLNTTRRNSALAMDSLSGSKDEELDLWGSFGFVGQDDSQLQPPPRSRDGFDDPGFGMVTEDDFSFFDDGAAGFGDFMEESLGRELEEIGGDDLADATMTDLVHERETAEGQESMVDDSKVQTNQRNGQDHDVSSGAASSTVDPPSLPGFTPGSISESSPAVGGMNMKTPRTPYSPNQDLADTAITIEGEYGSMENGSYAHHHFDHQQGLPNNHTDDGMNTIQTFDTPMGPPDTRFNANHKKQQSSSMPSRRDITSKYEQGKFAMPLHPARRKGGEEAHTEYGQQIQSEQDRQNGRNTTNFVPLRNRFVHRAGNNGRRFLASHVGSNGSYKGGRIGAIRADEEMSEATGDGTMSEHSSLMEDDSGDDDSFSSDESSDELEELQNQRQGMLKSSIDLLRTDLCLGALLDSGLKSSETATTNTEPAEWNDIVSHLIDNPQLRLGIRRKIGRNAEMTSFSRHDAQHLFAVMQDFLKETEITSCLNSNSSNTSTGDSKRLSLVRPMETCNFLVGCQESVVNIAPSALTYWDKLGLAAVGGPKDISAFALHTGEVNEAMQNEIRIWLNSMEKVYLDNGLGSHVMSENGLLDIGSASHSISLAQTLNNIANDAEQWSDTIESLVSRIVGALKLHSCVVIYAIGSFDEAKYMQSFVRLQRDLRTLASIRYRVPVESILVRPCSWESIRSSISMTRNSSATALPKMAMSIYDSIQVNVDAQYNKEEHLPRLPSISTAVRFPSFSILPSSFGNGLGSDFRLNWNCKALNILDKGTLLHVGYHLASFAGKPTILSIIDERAQGYTATAWRRTGTVQDEIRRMWDLTVEYTMRARTKWKVVICKDESMGIEEVDAWSKILEDKKNLLRANALDVVLTCTELQRAIAIIPPLLGQSEMDVKRQSAVESILNSKNGGKYIDASMFKYVMYPQNRIALRHDSMKDEEDSDDFPILPLRSSVIVTVPQNWNFATAVTIDHSEIGQLENESQSWSINTPHLLWTHLLQIYTLSENVDESERVIASSTSQSNTTNPNTPSTINNLENVGGNNESGINESLQIDSRLERITKSFQELELISRERAMLPLDDPTTTNLPWHLAIVQNLNNLSQSIFTES